MKMKRKPEWLQKKMDASGQGEMRRLLGELKLDTVCQQALCPNISECFSSGQATFLIMGRNCTRLCSFCNISKSEPLPVDQGEPERVAEGVLRLGLRHVVITSPTRDDLPDGGASIFYATVTSIREKSPLTSIELLVPDFQGESGSIDKVLDSGAEIIGHNLETVPRLYNIRSGADYYRSLRLLERCAGHAKARVKSGLMLGMGETVGEVLAVMRDMIKAGCTFLSIGQYLAPSRSHYPVQEYITPQKFEALKEEALAAGFQHVESSPYTRSSFHADRYR